MNIIKLSENDINKLLCQYGSNKVKISRTRMIRDYIIEKFNRNIYFFKININNDFFNGDPDYGVEKYFFLNINGKNSAYQEGTDIFFYYKLSFDIVFLNDINKLSKEIDNNYNYATIFGKGPTFRNIEKKDNELRCAVNQAANIASNVDLICMNDRHNAFKIEIDTYKNLKYILIPEYLHIEQLFNIDGYFVNLLSYFNNIFFGKLIIYNLNTSKMNTPYFMTLKTEYTSGNSIFEFLGKVTNIKNVDIYGMGVYIENQNYNNLFIGNGNYTEEHINIIIRNLNYVKDNYNIEFNIN